MVYLYLIAWFALVTLTVQEITTTTISLQGGGSVTNFISRKFRRLLLELSKRIGSTQMLSHAGCVQDVYSAEEGAG